MITNTNKFTLDIMTDIQLYNQIAALPADLKKEVADFAAFLKQKSKVNKQIKERQFGYAKDFLNWLQTLMNLWKISKNITNPYPFNR